MKPIVLNKIRLLNFKGARDVEIKFSPQCTKISGRNGTGKTTIFDALTWLLFGKDSQDREKVDFKTYDSEGNIIPRIPHEVSADITVGHTSITLTKRLTENWVKPNGSAEQVFKGNIIERLYNDVPCTETEYKAKIAEICPELIFKYITNPSYFCSKKPDEQRAMLLDMAHVTDADVVATNAEFNDFLKMIEGKKLAEFKKEIAAKKSHTKAEMSGIPDRIDELKRRQAGEQDWAALETSKAKAEKELNEIETQLLNESKRSNTRDQQLKSLYDDISRVRAEISRREDEVTKEVLKDYTEAFNLWNKLRIDDEKINTEIVITSSNTYTSELETLDSRRLTLLAEFKALSEAIATESQREISFSEDDFTCPTCGRIFEQDKIMEHQAQMIATFNAAKSAKIDELKAKREANRQSGLALKAKRATIEAKIVENETKVKELQERRQAIIDNPNYKQMPTRPDTRPAIESDTKLQELNARLNEMVSQSKQQSTTTSSDTAEELITRRRQIATEINAIDSILATREIQKRDAQRIAELESQYAVLASNLAQLEKTEFTIDAFNKAKNELIESRINGLFEVVKFRWLAPQINGAIKETCEASVKGVPFAILNHAAQIDAGLDIINAICKNKGISAPIFIDNAESCNSFRATNSQLILLEVSEDDKLKISNN